MCYVHLLFLIDRLNHSLPGDRVEIEQHLEDVPARYIQSPSLVVSVELNYCPASSISAA